MQNDFVWNDELVRDFALQVKINGHKDWVDNQMDSFKKSKETTLDYEILERFDYNKSSCDGDIAPIKSVRRISDNEVFTIGDKIDYKGQALVISNFELKRPSYPNNVTLLAAGRIFVLNYVNKFNRQPLLTTSDNIPIYEGTQYWIVKKSTLQITSLIGHPSVTVTEDYASFGTTKALDEYIERRKKVFSMADIFEVIKTIDRGKNGTEIRNFLNDKFLELLKDRK